MLGKLWAYVARGLRIELSYKLTFVGRYVGQLVYLLFLYFLGQVVESGSPALLGENRQRYFAFLLIGAVFSQYLTAAMRELPIKVRDELLLGSLESTLVAPLPTALALLGPALWSQIEATGMLVLSLLLGAGPMGADLQAANWVSAVVVTALSLICLTAWGILSVAFVVLFKRTDPINWLVGATLSFFSGVYFPISVLPLWLRVFSYLFPLTYSLALLRAALLDGVSLGELGPSLWLLVGLTVVFVPLSIIALQRAIQLARQRGSLAHY